VRMRQPKQRTVTGDQPSDWREGTDENPMKRGSVLSWPFAGRVHDQRQRADRDAIDQQAG
jgi:hypothetical protein